MKMLSGKVAAVSGGKEDSGEATAADHAGCGKAFESSLAELVCLRGLMVAVSRLLPGRH
jgi:hypothetical protein